MEGITRPKYTSVLFPPALTANLTPLERRGWVRVSVDPEDKRGRLMTPDISRLQGAEGGTACLERTQRTSNGASKACRKPFWDTNYRKTPR